MTIYFIRPATTWVLSQQADEPYKLFAGKKEPLHKIKLKFNIVIVSFLISQVITAWSSLVAQTVKHLHAMQETWVRSLGWEDHVEEGRATHSSTLSWRISWTEEPCRLQSMGLERVGRDNKAQHIKVITTQEPRPFEESEVIILLFCFCFCHLKDKFWPRGRKKQILDHLRMNNIKGEIISSWIFDYQRRSSLENSLTWLFGCRQFTE